MDVRLQATARWVLALVIVSATSFILVILLFGLMTWPDRPLVAACTAFGITPRAAIEVIHRLDFLLVILVWVVPSTCAIGFAARKSQRRALHVALSVSVLLFATVCFFLGRSDKSALMQSIAVIAGMIVINSLVFSFFRSNFPRFQTVANLLAALLLFVPSLASLLRKAGTPQPRELWSSTLQQEQWQSMNTGSEYGATRQVVFAGDRVVVVFDSGFAPAQQPNDKWPISTYRLLSLDLKTGATRNEITLSGRWGAMPYIYPMRGDLVSIRSNPPHTLNQELMPVADSTGAATASRRQRECGNASCDPLTYALSENTDLQLKQRHFQVRDGTGQVLSRGDLVDWGAFAGASADGRRFAIQSSYMEGDPDFVIYEYFTVYDSASGRALATVHIKDLPARQSWSAFSRDGRYFVAGNPNNDV